MKIRLGKITPLKAKTDEGKPIYSGTYETYDKQDYLRLANLFDEDCEIQRFDRAIVQNPNDIIMNTIFDLLDKIEDERRTLTEEHKQLTEMEETQ